MPPLCNSLLEVPAGFSVTPDDYWNSAFTGAGSYNGYANTLCTSSDDDLLLQLQVHRLGSQLEEAPINRTVHARNKPCFV